MRKKAQSPTKKKNHQTENYSDKEKNCDDLTRQRKENLNQ